MCSVNNETITKLDGIDILLLVGIERWAATEYYTDIYMYVCSKIHF